MFIGHLPAGYIISRLWLDKASYRHISHQSFVVAGMLGAVFPDIDMFYFYLVDHRQHHHHHYPTHYPIIWFFLLLLSLNWRYFRRDSQAALWSLVFTLNAFIHLFLDTIVGDIWWFAPFIDKSFAFFNVPALYHPWWLNFFFHWSFGLELIMVFGAILLWDRRRKISLNA